MASSLSPYLNFRESTRDAMAFYQDVFGGELISSTYAEFGVSEDPAERDKIMHAQLTSPSGFVLMGADVPNSVPLTEDGRVSISLFGDDATELSGYWEKLSSGGTIEEPLAEAPWGDSFGQCTDRFGITWLVNIAGSAS